MGKRILAVDDVDSNAQLISAMLGARGFEVSRARDGEEAVAMARSESPDLIVLDIMLPKLDGWEVRRLIRGNEATRDIPIIFLSALATSHGDFQELEPGLEDYMTKPFSPRALLEKVDALLQHGGEA